MQSPPLPGEGGTPKGAAAPHPLICLDPNEFIGNETWRLDTVMQEFVEGFRFLLPLKREVTFFGSARLPADDPWYQEAETLAALLTARGYTVITGGGPGIMEAANKGALRGCPAPGGTCSVGLNIILPGGERANEYVRRRMAFNYFFTRKVMLSASAQAYVFFPGGFGTVDELMEIATLIQTRKMERIPLVCVSKTFWEPFKQWMRTAMLEHTPPMIHTADLDFLLVVDRAEDALPVIETSRERKFF